jgi:hypothetical protein
VEVHSSRLYNHKRGSRSHIHTHPIRGQNPRTTELAKEESNLLKRNSLIFNH